METEPCKRSDVNFDGDENNDAYKFWKPDESFAVDTDRFFDIFQCTKEDPTLLGNYNSARGTLLSI